MDTKPRLGRGLTSLLGEDVEPANRSRATLTFDQIEKNPHQARKAFDEDEINQLSESIRNHGVLQPLVVRAVGEHYELIAGERRLRAAQVAGLREVPVTIVNFDDQQVFEASLVENIQRSDLNPIEKAFGFKEYLDRYHVTQEQLANRLGMDRTSVSNLVNLLNLPEEVQTAVRQNQISLGHAKILKGLPNEKRQVELCKEIVMKGLSVKALELIVKQQKAEAEAHEAEKALQDVAPLLQDGPCANDRNRTSPAIRYPSRDQGEGQGPRPNRDCVRHERGF